MNKGTLFYVVGASGAGKDSLMDYARSNLKSGHVKFASRYITRKADAGGENHIAVSHDQFQELMDRSVFSLYWKSHGNWYGVHHEINDWLSKGINVVVNGSRGYLSDAILRYPQMKTVLIEVSENVLRDRLKNRGRENDEEIEKRIERSQSFRDFEAPNMIRINNDQPLNISGAKFIESITFDLVKTASI